MAPVTALLASFWRLFTSLEVPLLGISFAGLWLGVLVVTISVKILGHLFGLAFSTRMSRADRRTARDMFHEKAEKWRAEHDS